MIATLVTQQNVTTALNCLSDLDNRLTRAECDRAIPPTLRGEFDLDTVNVLRSEFARLWRMAEESADGNNLMGWWDD